MERVKRESGSGEKGRQSKHNRDKGSMNRETEADTSSHNGQHTLLTMLTRNDNIKLDI